MFLKNYLSLLAGLLFCAVVSAQSITTVPTKYAVADAYTNSRSSVTNYGTKDTMDVDVLTSSFYYTRGFVKFDLSDIPKEAIIVSAKLRLTPKGTENVTTTTSLYLDLVNSSWDESTITNGTGIVNNAIFSTDTLSAIVSSKREFNVLEHVQAITELRTSNFGWRIRRNPENAISGHTAYYTREATTAANRPQLDIQYYLPAAVSAVTITHATSLTATNGSIAPTVINGGTAIRSYRWYNSAGTQLSVAGTLTNVGYGWYGLKTYGAGVPGDTLFQAFIVGAQCEEVSISFNPGPNYINDAAYYDLTSGSGISTTDYKQLNNGNYGSELASNWTNGNWYSFRTLMKFNLWIDPAMNVTEANMTMYGESHSPLSRVNTSELKQVSAYWREAGVAYSNAPLFTTPTVSVPAVPAGTQNTTLDIKSYWDNWKTNNTLNYGMLFQLTLYNGTYTRQQYYSSDVTTAANRPSIAFKLSLTNCDLGVKGTTTPTYDNATSTCDLAVSLTPPSWAVAPYNYVISETAIPEQHTTYVFLKDSIYGGVLDSASFFRGTTSSTSYLFDDVPMGVYFISVFDSKGKRIYIKTSEAQPVLTLTNSTALSVSGFDITATAATGKAELEFYTDETTNRGKLSFKVNSVSGNQAYGLMNYGTTLSASSDIKFGFTYSGNQLRTISFGTSGAPKTVIAGKEVSLSFRQDTIIYTYNDTVLLQIKMPAPTVRLKGAVILNSASAVHVNATQLRQKPYVFRSVSANRRCDEMTKSYRFLIAPFALPVAGTVSYTLAGVSPYTTFTSYSSSGNTTDTLTIPTVPPGFYTLSGTITVSSVNMAFSIPLEIGAEVSWDPGHPNYLTTPNTYSLQRDALNLTPAPAIAKALSLNQLDSGIGGGVWFDPLVSYLPTSSDLKINRLAFMGDYSGMLVAETDTYLNFVKRRVYAQAGVTLVSGYKMIVSWHYPASGGGYVNGSSTVALAAHISTRMSTTQLFVYADGLLIATLPRPAGNLRLKANTLRPAEGITNVLGTSGCSARTIYAKLERQLTGVKYQTYANKFYFFYDEEYASTASLNYNVYNKKNEIVLTTSAQIPAHMQGTVNREYGDNRYSINVVTLPAGAYVLEVINEKGEKLYLRFTK